MNVNDYLNKGFKLVGKMSDIRPEGRLELQYGFYFEAFVDLEGKQGVYILSKDLEVLKIGETQDMKSRMGNYQSGAQETNSCIREQMEAGSYYQIYFLEVPMEEIEFAGVKAQRIINYKHLEGALLDEYIEVNGQLPRWNKTRK